MHPPTEEQAAILEAAVSTKDNLLVNALAGAAKTTTLEMICNVITDIPILSLAFNKRIADELSKRLPSHVECRTMNALGHRVWAQACARRLVVDSSKMRTILRGLIDELPRGEREQAFEEFSDTMKILSIAKRAGFVPASWRGPHKALCAPDEFFGALEEIPSGQQEALVNQTMQRSITAAYEGGIDFDDQIYMPVIFGGPWPRFPLTLIDEAQDLNEIQHEMLALLVRDRRVIAVGDPWQSIYAFRGAVSNSMTLLRERFHMRELTLSVTFRVPRLGVERAWSRVPHMKWRDGAPDGEIHVPEYWTSDLIPEHAAIICRNNAPLLSMAFRLLRQGRAVKLVGMDIGAGLVRILRKLGPEHLRGPAIDTAINKWLDTEMRRSRKLETLYDKAECLRALCEGDINEGPGGTLGQYIARAEMLFKQEGPIQLLSGHKAKGLEWDTVFHLDPWRVPSKFAKLFTEEMEQELNIKYVIETRFKKQLYLVNLENFE